MIDRAPSEDCRTSPLAQAREADRVCDRFEAEWRAGRRPRIEDYVGDASGPERGERLRWLLRLELSLRRGAGERPQPREYHERFPDSAALIDAVFLEVETPESEPEPERERDWCQGGPNGTDSHDPEPRGAARPGVAPATIGKYVVREKLGEGGQAEVFRVAHPELAHDFVLKLARGSVGVASPVRDRMLAEGRLLAGLNHPNLVRVVDLDFHDDRPFLVMEYIPGSTLLQLVAPRRLAPRRAAALVIQLARVVDYVHRHGVIHRDIAPKNVLIDAAGRPRLIDFGLALLRSPWGGDKPGPSGGTPAYRAPEQLDDHDGRVGRATDVFGLGAVLYALLTGRPLYQADSSSKLWELARTAAVTPPRQLDRGIPRSLEKVCLRALAREPGDRYATAGDLGRALRGALRQRWVALAAGAGLLGLGTGAVMMSRPGPPPAAPPVLEGTPVAGTPAPAVAPVRIRSLRVGHMAKRGESGFVTRGDLGERSFAVQPDDDVTVQAELSEPAYSYLIAFRPDGVDEVCDPDDPDAPPPKTRQPRYPPSAKADVVYRLSDGTGLHAFALVVSRRPLPSYREWERRHGTPKWGKGLSGAPGVVWWHDGQWLTALTADDPIAWRGKEARVGGGGDAVASLAAWLRAVPGVEAVAVKAFPVPPPSGPPDPAQAERRPG